MMVDWDSHLWTPVLRRATTLPEEMLGIWCMIDILDDKTVCISISPIGQCRKGLYVYGRVVIKREGYPRELL